MQPNKKTNKTERVRYSSDPRDNPLLDMDISEAENIDRSDVYMSGEYCRVCGNELTVEEAKIGTAICLDCLDEMDDTKTR